jgi:predicted nucleotidyltransferase
VRTKRKYSLKYWKIEILIIFAKIEDSIMRRPEIVQQIKNTLREINPDAKAILYGSEARGDARHDSDIDLLILVDKAKISVEEEKEIIGRLSDLSLETGVIISSIILPKTKWENRPLKTPFYLNVMNEGIVL